MTKIIEFETSVVSLPREEGPLTGGMGSKADFITIKLRTSDGLEGISYAGFTSDIMVKALKECIDALIEQILGENPLYNERIISYLTEIAGSGAPAGLVTRSISAIDVALWDIKGKYTGLPIYQLLGGYRDAVPAYASGYLWRNYDLDRLANTARDLVEKGFTAMKFRMGAEPTVKKEIERMEIMREAVGPDITLMVDINQGWDVNTSIKIGRELSQYDMYWLEDPINHQDYIGLASLADKLDTPIAAGEYHYGIEAFRNMLELKSIDIVMVDLMRVGGITQWMKVAHLAQSYNKPVVSHLATEVLAHGVAACPNGAWVEHMPWTFELFDREPLIKDGLMLMPQEPGLGVNFNEENLVRYKHTG